MWMYLGSGNVMFALLCGVGQRNGRAIDVERHGLTLLLFLLLGVARAHEKQRSFRM